MMVGVSLGEPKLKTSQARRVALNRCQETVCKVGAAAGSRQEGAGSVGHVAACWKTTQTFPPRGLHLAARPGTAPPHLLRKWLCDKVWPVDHGHKRGLSLGSKPCYLYVPPARNRGLQGRVLRRKEPAPPSLHLEERCLRTQACMWTRAGNLLIVQESLLSLPTAAAGDTSKGEGAQADPSDSRDPLPTQQSKQMAQLSCVGAELVGAGGGESLGITGVRALGDGAVAAGPRRRQRAC